MNWWCSSAGFATGIPQAGTDHYHDFDLRKDIIQLNLNFWNSPPTALSADSMRLSLPKSGLTSDLRCHISCTWLTLLPGTNEVKGKDLRVLVPQPDWKGLKIHTQLKKPQSSLLVHVQMRTGKIERRLFSYSRKILKDETWECGHTSQTVRHILMEYRKFNRLRQEIWKEERRKEPFGVVEWKKKLTYPPYTMKAIDFIQSTRLLKQYQVGGWD